MKQAERPLPLRHSGTRVIQTNRLLLRRFRPEDAADLFVWASNPKVVRYLSYTPHETVAASKKITKQWVKAYRDPKTYNWAIEYQGKVIGNISVVAMEEDTCSCHLGWQLDAPYWNQGLMTEAAKAVVDYLFEAAGFERISSGHDTRNIGSGRVMEKIGMLREGTFRSYILQKDGSIGDKAWYAILKSDWLSQKNQP